MQYADIAMAALGAVALAWFFDMATGRRGLFAALLVSGSGAAAGWFLAIRVFATMTMSDWRWVVCSMLGAGLALLAFFLFRNKR